MEGKNYMTIVSQKGSKSNCTRTPSNCTKFEQNKLKYKTELHVGIYLEKSTYHRNNNKLVFYRPDRRSPCLFPCLFCSKIKSLPKTSHVTKFGFSTNKKRQMLTQHTQATEYHTDYRESFGYFQQVH
jgi:hypothetical protein